jgi:hypothetical protein
MSTITPSGLPTELTEITNGETLIEVYNPDTGQNEKCKADTIAEFALINGVTTSDMEDYAITNNDLEVVDDDIPVFDGTTGKIVKSSGTTLTDLQSDISGKLTGTTDQICKGLLNYNGITNTIMYSFGVSSVTDNGTGSYTVNLSSAMSTVNYVVVALKGSTGSTTSYGDVSINNTTTTSFDISCRDAGNSLVDVSYISVVVFGE